MPIKSVASGATAIGKEDAPSIVDAAAATSSIYTDGHPYRVEFSPTCSSVFSAKCKVEMTHTEVESVISDYNTRVTAYNTALTTFNTAATAYNSAVTKEKARRADAFKGAFDPAIAIPTKPCPPSAVAAYTGRTTDFTGKTALTAAQKTAKVGTWAAETATNAGTYKHGWLQLSTDGAKADLNAGHVFGILGQLATWPTAWSTTTTKAAFSWVAPDVQHEMLVSVFPNKKALTATSDVTMDAINVQFKTYANQVASTPSATAATALLVLGAKTLAVGAVATAGVLATL